MLLAPDAVWSHADDAAFLASSYGLTPDPWQFAVLQAWLGETAGERWAAARCGLSVPRQNGKNGVLEIVELYKMVALGRRILHTAHEVKTARKAFLRLCSFFENERQYPELAAMVKEIRRTNGQEAIMLTNGGGIEFIARSKGSGRGFTVDDLVCDEAQELSEDEHAALLPTISAAPSGNPQVVFTGTPPIYMSDAPVWMRMRSAGVEGSDSRLAWVEWSVDGKFDVSDIGLAYVTNPALGFRLNEETILDELASMAADIYARERLGVWPSEQGSRVVDADDWAARGVPVAPEGIKSFAIDMSADRAFLSIAGAVKHEGGVHVEVIARKPTSAGTAWAVEFLASRWRDSSAIVLDGWSTAESLRNALLEAGVSKRVLVVTSQGDMGTACGLFVDAVRDGKMSHLAEDGQQALSDALAAAKKRPIGREGKFGWDRKSPDVDISPLVAVTLAMFGALTSKRKPGRKAQVMV